MSVFTLVAKLTLDSAEFDSKLSSAKEKASGIGNAISGAVGVGVKAFSAVTAATGAFAAASVKAGADFDTAMSQVQATMLKTSEQMENEMGTAVLHTSDGIKNFSGNLRDFAQFLGANTAFSATQAAEALNFMALAGYNTQQSMDMLPNVLNLAAAGAMDLATASDMVTDTQTAFGISAERTTQMVDEMAKAASTGNTSVQQLGEAFLVVGGLAQELNGGMVTLANGTKAPVDGLQEMEIALTAMANAGVKGSEAGTHMRNMIMKLSKPTKDGIATMGELSLKVWDAEGNMRSLRDIMSDLNTGLSTLTQEEKINAIADLFNARDLASAEALLGAVSGDWDKIGESILNASGSAAEMANIQLDNLTGDVTLFKSALEGVQISISDKLTPALREMTQSGIKGLDSLNEALGTGNFNNVIYVLTEQVKGLVKSFIDATPQFLEVGAKIFGSLVEGITSNADGFAELANTIFQYLVTGISENADGFIEMAGQLLLGLINGITEGLPVVTEGAVQILNGLAEGITANLPTLISSGMEALMSFSGSLRQNVGLIVDAGLNLIRALADSLIKNLPVFIQTVPTIISNIAGIINDNAPKLLACGVELIGKLALGVIQSIPVIIQEFPKILLMIANVITAFNWVSLGQHIITFLTDGVKSLVMSIPDALRDIVNTAGDIVKNFDWATLGKGIIEVIKQGIESLVHAVPDALMKIAKNAADTFKAYDWLSLGAAIISGLVSGIVNGAGQVLSAIGGLASDVLNAGKKALGIASPSKIFKYYGKMIDEGLALGITDNMHYVDSAMDNLVNLDAPQLAGATVGGMGGYSLSIGDINIYGGDAQSNRELADMVIDELDRRVRSERAAYE